MIYLLLNENVIPENQVYFQDRIHSIHYLFMFDCKYLNIYHRRISHRVTLYLITTICTAALHSLTGPALPAPGDQVPVPVAGPHTGDVVLTAVRLHPAHHLAVQPRPLLLHPVPVSVLERKNIFINLISIENT